MRRPKTIALGKRNSIINRKKRKILNQENDTLRADLGELRHSNTLVQIWVRKETAANCPILLSDLSSYQLHHWPTLPSKKKYI